MCDSAVALFGLTVGYQTIACPDSITGTNFRAMDEEVTKKVDAYANVLWPSSGDCQNEGVILNFKRIHVLFPNEYYMLIWEQLKHTIDVDKYFKLAS